MKVDTFTIDTHSSGKPLKCAAKRYRPHGASSEGRPAPGHILIFTHGTGFHKEHWEVPILRLFAHSKSGGTRVSEAWSIDWQTHGDSAALNEAVIEAPDFEFSEFDYAEACANLYRTFLLENIEKGLNKVVLLGHSAGAASASLATMFCDHPLFEAFIFVEPTIWPAEMAGVDAPVYKYVKRGILTRRDHWPTKAEAKRYFEGRAPWSYWDSRIRDIYVEYGLKADLVRGGWTLKCTPKHELAPFANDQKAVDVLPELNKTIKVVPIHLIYGGRNDMFSRKKQDSLLGGGRNFASVTRIPDAGHLVVQEAPDEVADVLFGVLRKLDRETGHFEVQAKL
ncbi:Alpha/beta hydrolase fold-1 [Armillaria fumosa]|nr:Alpha/beta hydrolase fold-1 [Armillaria fumosa]